MPTNTPIDPEEAKKKKLLATQEALKQSQEAMEFWRSVTEMLERLHQPVLAFFSAISEAIPPIKLTVSAVAALWEVGTTVLVGKKSKAHQATKIGTALTGLALGVTSFVFPVIAVGALIAGSVMVLAKDSVNCFKAWRNNNIHADTITEKNKIIAAAKKSGNHQLVATHQEDLKNIVHEGRVLKAKAINKTIRHSLGVMALVGAVLLATPFTAPIGAILLVTSAALGIVHAIGKFLWNKKLKKETPVTIVETSKNEATGAHKKMHMKDDDEKTLSIAHPSEKSTADIYADIASHTHDANHSTQEEAIKELQHSIETAIEKPVPAKAKHHELHHVEEFFHEPLKQEKAEKKIAHIHTAGQAPKPKPFPPHPMDAP